MSRSHVRIGALSATIAFALFTQPALAGSTKSSVQQLQVIPLAKCLFSQHTARSTSGAASGSQPQASPVAPGLLGSLVDRGFDLLVGAIRAAGEARTESLEAYNADDVGLPMPACLLVVAGNAADKGTNQRDIGGLEALTNECADPRLGPAFAKGLLKGRGIHSEPQWLAELEVHMSADNSAISFRPTCLHVRNSFISGGGSRDYLLFAGLVEPKSQASMETALFNAESSAVSLTILGRVAAPVTLKFDAQAPRSPWSPVPKALTTILEAGSSDKLPLTHFAVVTETRSANKFLLAMADALGENKGAITQAAKTTFTPSLQQQAYTAEQDALIAYSGKLAAAQSARRAVLQSCAPLFDTPPAPVVLTDAIATDTLAMLTAMRQANVAAAPAGEVEPFQDVPSQPGTDDDFASVCDSIRIL
jgi:hypothetical protein